jgi:BTB/POZ domain
MEALCEAVDIVITDACNLNKLLNQTSNCNSQFDSEKNLTEISCSSSPSTCDTSDDEEPMGATFQLNPNSRLNWRLNSKNSYTDYTIEVIINDDNHNRTTNFRHVNLYHVHKSVLAMGNKRSRYFANLFQVNYQRCDDIDEEYLFNKCQLHLTTDSAKVFPTLLDYLYSIPNNEMNYITMENVTALYHLGNLLQIDLLRYEAKQFWKNNMTISNCLFYYQESKKLNEPKIKQAVIRTCISSFSQMNLQSNILLDFEALPLWVDIAESRHRTNSSNENLRISVLIACFCKIHREFLRYDDFVRLTDAKCLPLIHHQVACPLLEVSKEFETTKGCDVSRSRDLVSLNIRCLDALAKAWEHCAVNPNFHRTLTNLNVAELSYLFATSLTAAHDEIRPLRNQQKIVTDQNVILQQSRVAVSKEVDFVIQDRNVCCTELKSMKRKRLDDFDPPGSKLEKKRFQSL